MNVSVVIPLYNKVRHIRRAIESVLAQTRGPFELIVVDDGSTDGSGTVVREIIDPRLRLITQPNAGECAARNRGIQEASGELIAFLDADDEWLPEFLKTVLALRAKYPEAGMYATAYHFCEEGKIRWPAYTHCITDREGGLLGDYFQAAMGAAPVTSSSVMIPKHVLIEVGGFPVGVRTGGDVHTWIRVALRYRVAWSPRDAAVYHLSADNRVCHQRIVVADVAAAAVLDEFLRSGAASIASRYWIEEYLSGRRLSHALLCYLHGHKVWMGALLKRTRGTYLYRKKRLLLLTLIWIPVSLAKGALRANTWWHRRPA